ncbi:MAG: glyoxalase [Lachnospiraceae bacterium]|nr:glyoxalase [Lachnospiraceae bacterium]
MSSYTYDKKCVKAFLDNQLKLYPEVVAETEQEAREFLEDTMAIVCDNDKEVIEYLEEEMDITGMSKQEILNADEVFAIGDGRYLVVEG